MQTKTTGGKKYAGENAFADAAAKLNAFLINLPAAKKYNRSFREPSGGLMSKQQTWHVGHDNNTWFTVQGTFADLEQAIIWLYKEQYAAHDFAYWRTTLRIVKITDASPVLHP
jgi:hypothetical protein